MMKIFIFRPIFRFWKKRNHTLMFETPDDFIPFELHFSKGVTPYPGGLILIDDLYKLKKFLDEYLQQEQAPKNIVKFPKD